MKQSNLLFAIAAFVFAQLLFSCSPSTNEGFAKRKYFDYKWDKKEYARSGSQKTAAPAPEVITTNESELAVNDEPQAPAEMQPVALPVQQENVKAPVQKHKKAQPVTEVQAPVMGAKEVKMNLAEKVIVKKMERAAEKKQAAPTDMPKWLLIIITILIPFLGVFLVKGLDSHFWISLLLTILFYIPGLIYSLIIVLKD